MKKDGAAIIALQVMIAVSAVFALAMLLLFAFSGSILPSGEDIEAGEQLQMALGYVLTSIILTALPSAIVFIALIVVDICLIAVKQKRKPLIACMVILPLFLPLFIISTLSYYVIIDYAKWLYAILISGYVCYVATLVLCAIALAKDKRARTLKPADPTDIDSRQDNM